MLQGIPFIIIDAYLAQSAPKAYARVVIAEVALAATSEWLEDGDADERWDEAHEHFYAYYAVPMYYNAWSHRRISDKLKQEERFPMKLAGAMSA